LPAGNAIGAAGIRSYDYTFDALKVKFGDMVVLVQ
jgi:hypothetical protein